MLTRIDVRHGGVKPGAGVPPRAVGGGERNLQTIGGLLQSQPAEIAQLDELALSGSRIANCSEPACKARISCECPSAAQGIKVGVLAPPTAAVLFTPFAAGILDEDTPHGLGGSTKEMSTIRPDGLV